VLAALGRALGWHEIDDHVTAVVRPLPGDRRAFQLATADPS